MAAESEERARRMLDECEPDAFKYSELLGFEKAVRLVWGLCLEGRPGCPSDFQARACASLIDLITHRLVDATRPAEARGGMLQRILYIRLTGIEILISVLKKADLRLAEAVLGTIKWLEGLLGKMRMVKLDHGLEITEAPAFGGLDPEKSALALDKASKLMQAWIEEVLYSSVPRDVYERSRKFRERVPVTLGLPPHPGEVSLDEVKARVKRDIERIVGSTLPEEESMLEELEKTRRELEEFRRELKRFMDELSRIGERCGEGGG